MAARKTRRLVLDVLLLGLPSAASPVATGHRDGPCRDLDETRASIDARRDLVTDANDSRTTVAVASQLGQGHGGISDRAACTILGRRRTQGARDVRPPARGP